jgi:hypothetical protein
MLHLCLLGCNAAWTWELDPSVLEEHTASIINTLFLKMKTVCSSETLVCTPKGTWRQSPEDQKWHLHCRESFNPHVVNAWNFYRNESSQINLHPNAFHGKTTEKLWVHGFKFNYMRTLYRRQPNQIRLCGTVSRGGNRRAQPVSKQCIVTTF